MPHTDYSSEIKESETSNCHLSHIMRGLSPFPEYLNPHFQVSSAFPPQGWPYTWPLLGLRNTCSYNLVCPQRDVLREERGLPCRDRLGRRSGILQQTPVC